VYGVEAVMPIKLEIASLRTALRHDLEDEESVTSRLCALERLDETRRVALWNVKVTQRRRKYHHDKRAPLILFWPGDLVMLIDSWLLKQHGQKFRPKWKGPYAIHHAFSNGSYTLSTPGGDIISKRYNGSKLKRYYHRAKGQPPDTASNT
jgi:hypothetical protein